MKELFKAYVFLAIFLLGCQSNDKVSLNHKQSAMKSQRGILDLYVDAFVISACKSSGQYNMTMSVRLENNTNDTIVIPSSKQATDDMATSSSYIEGTLYGQRVRFHQNDGDKQIPPHCETVLELFLDNFKPVPQGVYLSDDVICGDSIRSMSLDYVYKPSMSDKPKICRNIHFHAMQNFPLTVAPSNWAFPQISQCLKTIPVLLEGRFNQEFQTRMKYKKSNRDCVDKGVLDCYVGKVFVSAQEQTGHYNLAMSTVIWNNSADTVWLPMRKDVKYREAEETNVAYIHAVLLGKNVKINMWARTNWVPPYEKVRTVLFLKNFDISKDEFSNSKTICEDDLRNMSLIYHYQALNIEDPRMCKDVLFHVGQRTRLVVAPSNLHCGEIPLSYQKVYKGEPVDY